MENRKTEMSKTDMLRSIGKKSGKSMESFLTKKREAKVGRICRKLRLQVWNKRVRVIEY